VRDGKSLRSEWLTYLETIGKRVQIKTNETTEEGDAESVDDDGHLLLRRSDGSLTSIATGDIAGFTKR
jgi:biotin-(acetyl-CoA carboxylase) ligase